MAILKPFKGFRPAKDKAKFVASRPYDVMNSDEAKIEAGDNKYSFLHVVKPEIDLPSDIDHYSPLVYNKAKENFQNLLKEGVFAQDKEECFYIYQQTMDGRKQTGLVGCAAVDDYMNDIIKKHELTRPDKEEDRKNHVRVANMNAEPVFFAYPAVKEIDMIVNEIIKENPEYEFIAEDGIGHAFWVVKDQNRIKKITEYGIQLMGIHIRNFTHALIPCSSCTGDQASCETVCIKPSFAIAW